MLLLTLIAYPVYDNHEKIEVFAKTVAVAILSVFSSTLEF